MELNSDLNIWAWIIISLEVFTLLTIPTLFGREREPWSYKKSWLFLLVYIAILFLALGVVRLL